MKLRKFIYLFVLAVLVAAIYKIPDFIAVRSVDCKSQFGTCSEQIFTSFSGTSDLSLRQSKKKLNEALGNNILVSDYRISFKFPDKIEVVVVEKRPRFALLNKTNNNFALVDYDGKILSIKDESNLPTVESEGKLGNVGEMVSSQQLFSLKLAYDINYVYKVKRIVLDTDHLIVELDSLPEIIFPLEGDRKLLVGKLNFILTSLKNDQTSGLAASQIKQIDLRFKNPVIR